MMIRKLTASFGKLENETLSFHDGLNVIHAPNESGKSTWCAFIRAMLYGVDSGERVRGGYLPDTATAPCSIKALRRNTSRVTPVSCSPAFAPVMPSTFTFEPV